MQKMFSFLLFIISFTQCNTCDDCEPFAEEPYLKIRFYKAVDSTANIVILDSINHTWAGNYAYYKDTVNTYLLPLNMNEDVSNFVISYRDTSDINTFFTNTLTIFYEREYIKQTDNNIIIQTTIKEILSDFSLKNSLCKNDPTNTTNCLSNDVIYQVYR